MLTLDFQIESFYGQDFGFFCSFKKAEVIEKQIPDKCTEKLVEILSSGNFSTKKNLDFRGDILLNNLSFKKEKIVRNYIQKHSLFLTDFFYHKNLTVSDNIKLFSSLWNKQELLRSTLSAFMLENVKDQKVQNLTDQERLMLNLTKLIACPSYMWFIDKKLIQDLNKENATLIDNIINIRIKQGGICTILYEI